MVGDRILFTGPSFTPNGRRGCCRSSFGNVFVILRALAADADSADHFSVADNRNSALQRSCSGQCQGCDPSLLDLIFEVLTRTSKNSGGSSFSNTHFDTGDLCVVEPVQQKRMTSVINDDNHSGA